MMKLNKCLVLIIIFGSSFITSGCQLFKDKSLSGGNIISKVVEKEESEASPPNSKIPYSAYDSEKTCFDIGGIWEETGEEFCKGGSLLEMECEKKFECRAPKETD